MELIGKAQAGDEDARDMLVERNTRLVWTVVKRFTGRGKDPEDLFQVGCIGLMKAVDKFNDSFDVKFSTYAVPLIRGEIQRSFRDDNAIKLPRSIQETMAKILKLELEQHNDPEEIAALIEEENVELVKTAITVIHTGRVMSVDENVFNSDEGEEVSLSNQLTGDLNSEYWFEKILLNDAMSILTGRERQIVELRFYKDLSQLEVANELGLSQVHISRQLIKILAKLKSHIEGKPFEPVKEVKKGEGRKGKGDREEAIRLLATTTLSMREIHEATGVPQGTLTALARKHRSEEVRRANLAVATKRKEKMITTGTKTGRFQSNKPNMSGVPKSFVEVGQACHN